MKKLVIFPIIVLVILILPACNFFKPEVDPETGAAISAQTEANVLSAFQGGSSDLIAASSTAKKTTKPWDGNYSISGSVTCKYNAAGVSTTTIPLDATPLAVTNNQLLDSSAKNKIMVSSKGKATVAANSTDENGIKTVAKIVYQFSKTGVTGKVTMTITIPNPEGGKAITAKCSGTVSGKKLK